MSERTLSLTFGRWGGIYATGNRRCRRVCLGWFALTFFRGEFTDAMTAWLDSTEPKSQEATFTRDVLAVLAPRGAEAVSDPSEDMWAEMFAAVDVAPVAIPLLTDKGGDLDGADLVRPRRRVRIQLPTEFYAGANPMTRSRNLATAAVDPEPATLKPPTPPPHSTSPWPSAPSSSS